MLKLTQISNSLGAILAWTSPEKQVFGTTTAQRGCSLTCGLLTQDVALLAKMAFAREATICKSGCFALSDDRNLLPEV